MTKRFCWSLVLAATLTGCAVVPGTSPARPAPVELPPGDVTEVPQPTAPARRLMGAASLWGQPFAQSVVSVQGILDGHQIGDQVASDGQGAFQFTVAPEVPTPAVTLVTATKGETVLQTLATAPAIRVQAAGDPALTVGSTIAVRSVIPKLVEVYASLSGTPASRQRLMALIGQITALGAQIDAYLTGEIHDVRVAEALQAARGRTDVGAYNRLAAQLMENSDIAGAFKAIIVQANLAYFANIREGGPFIYPRPWGSGTLRLDPPIIIESEGSTLVTYEGTTDRIRITPDSRHTGERLANLMSWLSAIIGSPFLPPSGSGGGGSYVSPPATGNGQVGVAVTPSDGGAYPGRENWAAGQSSVTTRVTVQPGNASPTHPDWSGAGNSVNAAASVSPGQPYAGPQQWSVNGQSNTVYGTVTVTPGHPHQGGIQWAP